MTFKEIKAAIEKSSADYLLKFKDHYHQKDIERDKFIAALDHKSFDFQIATWFGSGLMIPAPGTWGTVGGLLFGLLLWSFTNGFIVFLSAVALFILGLKVVANIEKQLNSHDPSFIVIDEVAAILLVLSFNSLILSWLSAFGSHGYLSFILNVVTFILFRYFDAKKPGFIGVIDRETKDEWGVMMDDIMAALYTIGVTILLCVGVNFLFLIAG